MMQDQFSRTALMLGQESIEKMKSCRIAIFGIGGVGGHCAEALCRSGIGTIDLFDGDMVDITNINRQLIATHKTVGRDKVSIMRERMLEINPEVTVKARKLFFLPKTADEVDLSVYDYIIDAVDTITAKLELVCRATALGVPIISSMGAANKLDPTAFEVADIYKTSVCPIARIMRSELRKRGVDALKVVYSKEPPVQPAEYSAKNQTENQTENSAENQTSNHYQLLIPNSEFRIPNSQRIRQVPASNAFVPPVAGLIMAAEVVKDLTGYKRKELGIRN